MGRKLIDWFMPRRDETPKPVAAPGSLLVVEEPSPDPFGVSAPPEGGDGAFSAAEPQVPPTLSAHAGTADDLLFHQPDEHEAAAPLDDGGPDEVQYAVDDNALPPGNPAPVQAESATPAEVQGWIAGFSPTDLKPDDRLALARRLLTFPTEEGIYALCQALAEESRAIRVRIYEAVDELLPDAPILYDALFAQARSESASGAANAHETMVIAYSLADERMYACLARALSVADTMSLMILRRLGTAITPAAFMDEYGVEYPVRNRLLQQLNQE